MNIGLSVRNCNPQASGDRNAYERLKGGVVFAHLLSRPCYQVAENLFFAEANGVIIGYINVLPEHDIGRVILEYGASPTFPFSQVALQRLLDRALERAKQLGIRTAHTSIPAAESAQAELLSSLGFKVVRSFFELRLDVTKASLEASEKSDITIRHLRADENELLALIENRCFAGTWGFNPNTSEMILWELNTRGCCPDDVILAISESKPVGYCWTEPQCGRDPVTGKNKGRVYMLGVDSPYRNRGIGKELLKAGLLHLKNKKREIIDITVDSQNTAAVTLYRSLGFEPYSETVWFEKIID